MISVLSAERTDDKESVAPSAFARGNARTTPDAPLAQLVEQLTLNQWVPGSNP